MKTITEAIVEYWFDHVQEMDELEDAIADGKAFVLGTDQERIVWAPRTENGVMHVVVWLGISVSQEGLQRHTETMRNITRGIGGRWFEFYTKRKGFIRVASRYGFERMPDEEDGVMKFRLMV